MKTPRIRNILVPIDFSEMSIKAVKTARRLARHFNAIVHLAHVRQIDYTAAFAAGSIVPFPVLTYNGDTQKRVVEDLNALARECHVSSPVCHVLGGAPAYDEICRLAQKIPADLIVMPTHGRTGLKHVFLGSSAERIVQHSPCPVLVARERKTPSKTGARVTTKTVLVPVDFSDCSRRGLEYAIGLAKQFGAKIILLHATYLGYVYSGEGTAIYDIPSLQKAARKTAERKMRELVRSVNFRAVTFETAFTDGSPVTDISAFARDHDVDLIITSTHGFTGFTHVLIGSIAEQVVRRAPCSVLVVPSHPHVRMAHLAKPDRVRARILASRKESSEAPKGKTISRKDRKLAGHAFPERRKTNKFRELHFSR